MLSLYPDTDMCGVCSETLYLNVSAWCISSGVAIIIMTLVGQGSVG